MSKIENIYVAAFKASGLALVIFAFQFYFLSALSNSLTSFLVNGAMLHPHLNSIADLISAFVLIYFGLYILLKTDKVLKMAGLAGLSDKIEEGEVAGVFVLLLKLYGLAYFFYYAPHFVADLMEYVLLLREEMSSMADFTKPALYGIFKSFLLMLVGLFLFFKGEKILFLIEKKKA